MKAKRIRRQMWFGLGATVLFLAARAPAQSVARIRVDWSQVEVVSKTSATLQVVVNPLLRRGSPIHDKVFDELKDLECDDVRYVPWLPYPKLAVAELDPPTQAKTSWDFSLIDPMMEDFMAATAGQSVIINFSTIPQWMFKTPKPVSHPTDPNQVFWNYEQGTGLRDPTMKEVADYYARLVGWYTQGGFTDELGQAHESGHHYKIAGWEILNEVDFEHSMSPQFYTRLYDAIATAVRAVDPEMKFVGGALASPSTNPRFFDYFLDPANHQAGIPLDVISYHFYATPTPDQDLDNWQYTFFDQADHFLDTIRYVQAIRQRLSPETKTDTDELGCILPNDNAVPMARQISDAYWNLCGAMYAYLYAQLAHLGVEVAGESQLVGYPSQFPSVSMVDWTTGAPNARYWVLKLIHDSFGPGDKLVKTAGGTDAIYAQGFLTPAGKRKILLVNKRDRKALVEVSGSAGARERFVDEDSDSNLPGTAQLANNQIVLSPFEVSVLTLP